MSKNEIKTQVIYFICTSAIRRALRIALQDPAFYLDLCREAGFCFYYCLNAADERAFFLLQ